MIPAQAIGITEGIVPESLPTDSLAVAAQVVCDSIPATGAADIFGPFSTIADSAAVTAAADLSIASGPIYNILVLALLVIYLVNVLPNLPEAAQLIKAAANTRHEGRDPDEYSHMFGGFANMLTVTGYLTMGIAAVKIAALWLPESAATGIWAPLIVVLGIGAALFIIFAVQRIIMRAAGALTLNGPFIRQFLALRRLLFASMTLCLTPLVLLFALAQGTVAMWLIYVFMGAAALFIIHYLYRSLHLFLCEKVSVLLWFLYLCIVELMPFAIPVLALLRGMQL